MDSSGGRTGDGSPTGVCSFFGPFRNTQFSPIGRPLRRLDPIALGTGPRFSSEVRLRSGPQAAKTILRGWLLHRAALRAVGFDRGFQWLDGRFVEDKVLKDLDVVSFTYVWFAVSHAAPLRLCRGVAANPSQTRSERGG